MAEAKKTAPVLFYADVHDRELDDEATISLGKDLGLRLFAEKAGDELDGYVNTSPIEQGGFLIQVWRY